MDVLIHEAAELSHDNPDSRYSNDGPSLIYTLQEDLNHKNQLAFWDPKIAPKTADYRPSEQQLLDEGKLARSEFSARLQQVTFGTFKGKLGSREPACLILFLVDFCPRNRSWFRFRSATVEAEFSDHGAGTTAELPQSPRPIDEGAYDGPIVRKYYPEIIRGHIRTMLENYSFNVATGLPAPANVTNLSGGWSMTRPTESCHLIHGRLVAEPANRVKWDIKENQVNKSGIYERPKFAVIVKHADLAKFSMSLKIKGTTMAGLPVVGTQGRSIVFTPIQTRNERHHPQLEREVGTKITSLPGLSGGSISDSGQVWIAASSEASLPRAELEQVDLEGLTQMEAVLLGKQGPGAQVN